MNEEKIKKVLIEDFEKELKKEELLYKIKKEITFKNKETIKRENNILRIFRLSSIFLSVTTSFLICFIAIFPIKNYSFTSDKTYLVWTIAFILVVISLIVSLFYLRLNKKHRR